MTYKEELKVQIFDGDIDDKIKGDVVCGINIPNHKISNWIRDNREPILGSDNKIIGYIYPSIFIFEDRKSLNKFKESVKLLKFNSWVYSLKQLHYALSSYIDNVRVIKHYDGEDLPISRDNICTFIDDESLNSSRIGDLALGVVLGTRKEKKEYREIFYIL